MSRTTNELALILSHYLTASGGGFFRAETLCPTLGFDVGELYSAAEELAEYGAIAINRVKFAEEFGFTSLEIKRKDFLLKYAEFVSDQDKKQVTSREAVQFSVPEIKTNGRTVEKKKIFIGHGHSGAWTIIRDFIRDRLSLDFIEFNSSPTAGLSTSERLSTMLLEADFALLIMTAEDETKDGLLNSRMNVVHEAGLFQGKLGFRKAIIILENGCEEFSNVFGLGQIRFDSDSMSMIFEDIRQVLERENIITRSLQ